MYISDPEIEKKGIINRYRSLLRSWRPENPEQKKEIRKAFNIAVEAHKNMRRRTGEPYIYHPLEVARIVAEEIGLGKTSIVCALLHDVVEDTEYTLADIEKQFGKPVAGIIDGLTKIKDVLDIGSPSIQAENFKKMLLTLSNDVRVILIKLADRLHNMRTLESMPLDKQLRIASETTYLYAPLAHRLGLYAIKTELEDLALKHTEPEVYQAISERLKSSEKERKRLANRFIFPIKKSLSGKEFNFDILYRNKSIHSIWNKMKTKGIPLEEVYDLMAVRVIIDTEPENEKVDCWRVYSILTDYYRPKFDRLRDWISIPKANGYEALHTTVMSKDGNWVEVQIRSRRMDEIAEKGYAAHWRYKTANPSQAEMNVNNWLDRIRDMLQSSDTNALDFIDDFQGFLFADEIYVFTPTGELRNLPLNSSVLDFAYAIHSEIGNSCIGAKVNYKLAPIHYKLRSGDQVEVLTSQKQVPKDEWFNYVVTARARTQIKNGVKEEKKKFAEKGKEMLQSFFVQIGADFSKNNLKQLQQKYNYASIFDLYYDTAHGLIGLKEVKDCCSESASETWFSKMMKNPFSKSRPTYKQTITDAVIDQLKSQKEFTISSDAVKKVSYHISTCCYPIPGDDVVGFLTQNESIQIHRTTCPLAVNQMSKYGDRIIRTRWNDKESVGFLTGIEIHGIDEKGFIKQVIKVVTEELDLNIKSFHLETEGQMIDGKMMLYVYSLSNLNQLLSTLKKLPSVKKVARLHAPMSL